jgi:uncharacterized protein
MRIHWILLELLLAYQVYIAHMFHVSKLIPKLKTSSSQKLSLSLSMSSSPTSSSPSAAATAVYILQYTYTNDMINKRTPYRAEHLSLAQGLVSQGKIIVGGALGAAEGGLFVFRGQKQDVEDFVKKDPYVKEKLVTDYSIKEWNVVLGSLPSS